MKHRNRIYETRYWYFITQENMGRKVTLKPRCPHSMADGEPDIARICVAPTAAHCMSAIGLISCPIFIYRTARRVAAAKAWDVSDSKITEEHFILKKTTFELVSVLSAVWAARLGNRGVFEDRGACPEDSPLMYQDQIKQKKALVRAVGRIDKALAHKSVSNTRFGRKGDAVLIDRGWEQKSRRIAREDTKDEVLGMLNYVPKPWFPKQSDGKLTHSKLETVTELKISKLLTNSV